MSQPRMFSSEEKNKLTQLVNEGLSVMQEVETLNGGLNDTVKAIAEEMEIPAGVLKKAIKTAHKSSFSKEQENHDLLEQILTTVGRTL